MAEVKDDEYEADEESDESEYESNYESSEEASDADHKSDSCTQAEMGISASRRAKRKRVAQQDDNSTPFKKRKNNRKFLPYEEAKKVVNALGLKSRDDWERWSRTERPPDIPSAPWETYKNAGWNGFGDWLGKKKRPVIFLPYEEWFKKPNKHMYGYIIDV